MLYTRQQEEPPLRLLEKVLGKTSPGGLFASGPMWKPPSRAASVLLDLG
jgi:hypothetical protein